MAIIRNKEFCIEQDFKEKISWNFEEIKRNLDGNIFLGQEKKEPKIQLSLEASCEILLNLRFLEIYEVIPKQFFALCGKNSIEIPYKFENDGIICQKGKSYIFDAKKKQTKDGAFKINGKIISGEGDFCFLFRPVLLCFLVFSVVEEFSTTLQFEEN